MLVLITKAVLEALKERILLQFCLVYEYLCNKVTFRN